jgi:endonuclease IV
MFGSHLSICGGMHNALLRAEELKMDTVQIFTAFWPGAYRIFYA